MDSIDNYVAESYARRAYYIIVERGLDAEWKRKRQRKKVKKIEKSSYQSRQEMAGKSMDMFVTLKQVAAYMLFALGGRQLTYEL
jgi:hypothetical protein